IEPLGEFRQARGRIAHNPNLHGVTVGDLPAINVDLDSFGSSRFRVELRPGVVGADDQQCVAVVQDVGTGGSAEVAHGAGSEGQRLVDVRLSQQAGGDAGLQL